MKPCGQRGASDVHHLHITIEATVGKIRNGNTNRGSAVGCEVEKLKYESK